MAIKMDRVIGSLFLFSIVSCSMLLHTLTALTLKGYYGTVWGVVSFFLPGFAELFLVIVQHTDRMYSFATIFGITALVIFSSSLLLFARKYLHTRLAGTVTE
jgi:hypothetical protein